MFGAHDCAAFGLTLALEVPICAWITRLGLNGTLTCCVLLNGVTWFTLHAALPAWDGPVYPLEFAVIAVEALLIRTSFELGLSRAFAASLAMNLTSWLLGTPLIAWWWSAT